MLSSPFVPARPRKHIRSSNQRSKSSLLLRKTKIILTFFMSSHNTKRGISGSGKDLISAVTSWTGLHLDGPWGCTRSPAPKGTIQGTDLVARPPSPALFLEFTSAGALLQLVPGSILNAEEGEGACRSRGWASWARGLSRRRERGIAFHDPRLESWPDFLSCVLTIPIGRDFQPLSIYTHFFSCQHCLFT